MIYAIIKRTFDIVTSLVMIVILSPAWLIITLLVKLTSPGPVFFTQPRGGLHGKPFTLIKFRTMRTHHVHDTKEIIPLSHPNITPLGRLLRRLKLDELPQLVNVLKGDMSIIGPRPTIMEQVLAYDDFKKRRLEVRPGCTGLAQVNGSGLLSWDERIKYDVYYVDHLGLTIESLILAKTILIFLMGDEYFSRPFDKSPYAKKP
ncbi:MAG: sugar transferase [Planctomycetota bacterium]|jgi:lipopolysaccharide/colanic/teichoic acid biosynthesis glycosyltransferase